MKTYAALPLALLALIASRPAPHPAPQELTDAERSRVESEVSDFLASYKELIKGDDTEAIRRLYVDDGRFAWFTDGEKRYTSGDGVLAALAGMGELSLSTEASDLEVVPLTPHLAHARSAFHTEVIQGGAVVYEFDGVTTWLLEEVRDGEWRVLTGHSSTPKQR